MAGNAPNHWFRVLALALLTAAPLPAAELELGIGTSPAVATVGRDLTYSLTLTNRSGLFLTNLVVRSFFNESVELVSMTNALGTAGVEEGYFVYRVPQMTNMATVPMKLVVQPLKAGQLTNTFELFADGLFVKDTNVVNRIFAAQADLGIQLRSETNVLVTGDWTPYRLTVTNAGPDPVPLLTITNLLPVNSPLISLTPSNPPVSLVGTRLLLQAGALPVGSNLVFDLVIQANTRGSNLLSAQVSARTSRIRWPATTP